MNDDRRIEQILRDLYLSVKKDGSYINKNIVYNYFIRRDVNSSDKTKDLGQDFLLLFHDCDDCEIPKKEVYFRNWISRYKNIPNINVFWEYNWPHFCQFTNGDIDTNCIKIYVPLDYQHIEQGANKLFDFIAANNIKHESKISSMIRFDDIVIRVSNSNDAKKIQDFINSDPYFREGFIKNNPFAFTNNGVSYAWDHKTSYNSCLSSLINKYIARIVKDRRIKSKDITVDHFYSFIDEISRNPQMVDNMINDLKHNTLKCDKVAVINLLKLRLKYGNNLEVYNRFTEFMMDESNFRRFQTAVNNDEEIDIELMMLERYNDKSSYEGKKDLLKEVILTTMKKYPLGYDREMPRCSGFDYLNTYFNGDIIGITRTNNLRDRVGKNLTLDDVILFINEVNPPGTTYQEKFEHYIEMIMLDEIIRCSNIRFNGNGLDNIDNFIDTNDNVYITHSVDEARILSYTLDANRIKNLFTVLGVSNIKEYNMIYSEKNLSANYK